MVDELFRQGGPLNTKRKGQNEYEFRIDLPSDEHGFVGRECINEKCSPGYFKVKPGTGITEGHTIAFCPYCRAGAEPREFLTESQKEYAIALIENETIEGVNRILGKALGIGPSGKKKYGSGMFSLEYSFKPSRKHPVPRPLEEELRRNITCPHCGLEHAVFGLATWCSDCGEDIFITHVENEIQVVLKMITAIPSRRDELGARVAGRDIENSLEDLVSLFEAVMKVITIRHLQSKGMTPDEITEIMTKKVRNSYQNVVSTGDKFNSISNSNPYEGIPEDDVDFLRVVFEKRHPITHNLGVVDRKYLEQVRSGELEGREVRVTEQELLKAIDVISNIISNAYHRVIARNSLG